MSVDNYIFNWTNIIMTRLDTTGIQIPDGPGKYDDQFARKLPLLSLIITTGEFVIFFSIIYCLHRFIGQRSWQLLILTAIGLAVALFLFNIQSYYSANKDLNVQVRYLISFVPIIIALGLASLDLMVKRREVKLGALAILMILSTQGAGAMKHVVSMREDWYWQNNTVKQINQHAKAALKPIIYDKPLR